MNFIKAIKLVGNFPVVEGPVRTFFIIVGFLGLVGSEIAIATGIIKNDFTFVGLVLIFVAIWILPLYYPRP